MGTWVLGGDLREGARGDVAAVHGRRRDLDLELDVDPGGAFAGDLSGLGSGALQNSAGAADASNQFVKRASFDPDGVAPFGSEFFTGIPGFQLTIADVPATPASPSKAKKCKKKKKKP